MAWGGVFPCEPDWAWDTAVTPLPDFDLWAVFGGRGSMDTPDGPLNLAQGDCLLLRPRRRYVCRCDPGDPLLVHVIHFDYLEADGSVRVPPEEALPPLHRPLVDVEFFRALTARTIRAHLDGAVRSSTDWLQAALHELESQDRERAVAGPHVDPRTRRILEVKARILADPGRSWRVADLAASCHLSPDHFTRLFKSELGLTPREFIMRCRIDAARRLLLSSSHSVARIAALTGFSDIYHFSRQFKARAGRSPSRFRRLAVTE
jgi:AraC-like DNA-binding protein